MTLKEMINEYNRRKASTAYILGFDFEGFIYYYITREIPEEVLKMGTNSEHYAQIRIRFNKRLKTALVRSRRASVIGTVDALRDEKYNRGEMFEKLITEQFTTTKWKKDNRPFYQCGDIEMNSEQYQIKFDKAELTNEKRLCPQ